MFLLSDTFFYLLVVVVLLCILGYIITSSIGFKPRGFIAKSSKGVSSPFSIENYYEPPKQTDKNEVIFVQNLPNISLKQIHEVLLKRRMKVTRMDEIVLLVEPISNKINRKGAFILEVLEDNAIVKLPSYEQASIQTLLLMVNPLQPVAEQAPRIGDHYQMAAVMVDSAIEIAENFASVEEVTDSHGNVMTAGMKKSLVDRVFEW